MSTPAAPLRRPGAAAIALAAAFAYAFVRGGLLPGGMGRTLHGVTWSVALAGALVGGGAALLRRAGAQRPSLALAGAVGMAAYLALGGAALLLGIASRPFLLGSVALGLLAGAPLLWRWRPRRRALTAAAGRLRRSPLASAAFVLVALVVLGDVWIRTAAEVFNPRDDGIAYVPLAADIVARGVSIQPFSFRRACVLGGQELLHATFLAARTDPRLLRAVESGIGGVLVLLFGVASTRSPRARLLPLLAIAALPIVGIQNVASDATSAVLLLGWMALRELPLRDERLRAAFGGALLAGLVSLRSTNLVPAVVLLVTDVVAPGAGPAASDASWRERLLGGVQRALFTVALLLPWLRASARSNGSWLYPIDTGYYQSDFALVVHGMPPASSLATLGYAVAFGSGLWIVFTLVTGALLGRSEQRTLLGVLAGMLAMVGVLLLKVPDTDRHAMTRYLHPFVTALWVGSAAYAARGAERRAGRPAALAALAGVAVLLARTWTTASDQRAYSLAEALRHAGGDVQTTHVVLDAEGPHAVDLPPKRREVDYASLQAAVPPGETILAMVDDPGQLDFDRNPIWIVDLPGAEAPPPGYPAELEPAGLAASLRGASVRWVLVVLAGRSSEAYLAANFRPTPTMPSTLSKMVVRIAGGIAAYQGLAQPALIVAKSDDLALLDLQRAP